MKPTVRYLCRRGEMFQLRLPVPKDLQSRIEKRELRWSLETKNKRTAELRVWKAAVYFSNLCASIRLMEQLTNAEIRTLVREFFDELKNSFAPPKPMVGMEVDKFYFEQKVLGDEATAEWKSQLQSRDYEDEVIKKAKVLLSKSGMNFEEVSKNTQDKVLNGLLRAQIEYQSFASAHLEDPLVEYVPIDELFAETPSIAAIPQAPVSHGTVQSSSEPASTQTVKELVDEFIDRGKTVGYGDSSPWKNATIKLYERALPWFVELVGPDTLISELSKNDVKKFRDILQTRPVGLSSSASVFDIPQADVSNRVSGTTARNELGTVQSFLKWCLEEGYTTDHISNVVPIKKAKVPQSQKRKTYTPEQLNYFFSSPVYSGCLGLKKRSKAGVFVFKDARYWAPLLLLYTGARISDLAALLAKDVNLSHEIPHFQFRMRDGNLKEIESDRDTPIHPDLLEFGFAKFVEKRLQKDPEARLFGEMQKQQPLRETMSKELNKYRKSIGLDVHKLDMHSFRHTMIDILLAAACPEQIAERITGHKITTVHGKYGTGKVTLEGQLKFLQAGNFHLTESTKEILRKPGNG